MKHRIVVNHPGDRAFTFQHESPFTVNSILEEVFGMFNHGSGSECETFIKSRARSLSVHDFVRVNEQWFQCQSVGWKEVTQEFVDQLEKDVVENKNFKLYGPWSALQDVMWTKYHRI
jgi:hypothetical protein